MVTFITVYLTNPTHLRVGKLRRARGAAGWGGGGAPMRVLRGPCCVACTPSASAVYLAPPTPHPRPIPLPHAATPPPQGAQLPFRRVDAAQRLPPSHSGGGAGGVGDECGEWVLWGAPLPRGLGAVGILGAPPARAHKRYPGIIPSFSAPPPSTHTHPPTALGHDHLWSGHGGSVPAAHSEDLLPG